MFVYKYSQIPNDDRITYRKSLELCRSRPKFHFGQLKLFFTELMFLSKHSQPLDTILYIGAAPGYHINKLAELFPNLNFDLWDPRDFEIDPKPNVKLYQEFFTDTSASSYSKQGGRILLMCDLRTITIGKLKKTKNIEEMDELVDEDMKMQRRWCQIINPYYAYLKFRLPYEIPKTKYLGGTIYLQPYTKISTETRLMTSNYTDNILYDNDEFQEKMAYHNACDRCNSAKYLKWEKIMDKYNLVNNWDNALALYITHFFLKNVRKIYDKEAAGKLFMDILEYHIKKYGKKYDAIFVK